MIKKVIGQWLMIAPLGLTLGLPAFATQYYVSPSGSDSNNGTSTSSPWQTLAKVNSFVFPQGSTVSLQGGQTFSGNLLFNTTNVPSSSASTPFTVNAYGTGVATISAGTGGYTSYSAGVTADNVSGMTINGLKIVQGSTALYGVLLENSTSSSATQSVTVENCEITGFGTGEIFLIGYSSSGSNGPLSNVQILNNLLHGSSATSNDGPGVSGYGDGENVSNVTVQGNTIYNLGMAASQTAGGITGGGWEGAIVQYNLVHDVGAHVTSCGGTCGIEMYACDSITVRYNEVYNVQPSPSFTAGCDFDGIDLDGSTTNSVCEYNYTHHNAGAGLLAYTGTASGYNAWGPNTYRYNISENDDWAKAEGALFAISAAPPNPLYIYGNTFYDNNSQTSQSTSSPCFQFGYYAGAWASGSLIADNIIYMNNPSQYGGCGNFIYNPLGETGMTIKNNLWYTTLPVTGWNMGGTVYSSFSTWQTAGFESNGIWGDPKFTSPGGGGTCGWTPTSLIGPQPCPTAYQLQSGSPALAKGVVVSGNGGVDYYQSTLTNPPSIGAYSGTGGPQPPAAPTGLTATAGNAQVALSWTASSGAPTSYNVYRGTTAGGESTTAIATGITSTSYTNTGLTNGTAYYFKVAAVNNAGTSGNSNEASATPYVPTGPFPNGTYTLTPQSNTGERLEVTGAGTANGTAVVINAASGLQQQNWTFTLTANNVYKIQPAYSLGMDLDVSGQGTTNGTPMQIWQDNGQQNQRYGATSVTGGYTFTDEQATGLRLDTVGAGTASGTGATMNTASGGNSQVWAIPGSAPGAPTGLFATPGNTQVALSWSPGSGATSYNIYRGTTSGGENSTAIATGITSTSYTNTSLTNGATYYYEVKALNSSGTSGYSNEASATPAASGSIGYMQSNSNDPVTAQTITVAYPSSQTAGDLNVVVVGWNDTSSTISSVTDSAGNSYSVAIGVTTGPNQRQAIYYSPNIHSGSNTVTVTMSTTVSYPDIRVLEYSGVSTLDVTAGANGTSTSPNSGPATTTTANELIFTADTCYPDTTGVGSGFTTRMTTIDGDIAADKTVSATGSYSGSATLGNSGSWVMQMATFKGSGGGSAPGAPTGLSASPGNAQVSLSWTASTGSPTSYNVYRGTSAGGESGIAIATGIASTSYTNTGLTNGATYYYKVAAVNSYGTSGMSNEASATPTNVTTLALFIDSLQNGCAFTGGAVSVSSPVYTGTAAFGETVGNYTQVGLGSTPAVPVGETTLQEYVYIASPAGSVTAFIVQLGAPTYNTIQFTNSNNTLWTVDGAAGNLTMTANAWHKIRLNLSGAFGGNLVPGTTTLNNVNTEFTSATESVYMDSVYLEP